MLHNPDNVIGMYINRYYFETGRNSETAWSTLLDHDQIIYVEIYGNPLAFSAHTVKFRQFISAILNLANYEQPIDLSVTFGSAIGLVLHKTQQQICNTTVVYIEKVKV